MQIDNDEEAGRRRELCGGRRGMVKEMRTRMGSSARLTIL